MNRNKIEIIIVLVVALAGIIVALTAGFNVDMQTREHKQVVLKLEKEFKTSEISEITKEVLKDQKVDIKKAGQFEEDIVINAEEITDEQKSQLVTKINEKFETELDNDTINIKIIPKTRILDIITPYILTFVIATILTTIYFGIRYKKLGIVKAITQPIITAVVEEVWIFGLISIVRLEIGKTNLLPIIFILYVVSIFRATKVLENELQGLKLEESKK